MQDNNNCDCKQQLCNKISALSGSSSKDGGEGDEAALYIDAVHVNKSDKYGLIQLCSIDVASNKRLYKVRLADVL